MISDFFLRLAASFIQFLLSFLPDFSVNGIADSLSSAWAYVGPWFALADYFAPVHEGLALLVSLVVLRGALVLWFAMNWFYSRIPFLGH